MSVKSLLERLQRKAASEAKVTPVTPVIFSGVTVESTSIQAGTPVTPVTPENVEGNTENEGTVRHNSTDRDDLTRAVQTAVMLADLVPVAQDKFNAALDDLLRAELASDNEAIDRAVFALEALCLRVWKYFEVQQTRERKVA